MPHDTVGATHCRTLTAHDQWPWVMGIQIILQFWAGNGVYRMSEKILEWDQKPQTNAL